MLPVGCVMLLAVAAVAGESDFNGRWDIRVHDDVHPRAWWLKVEGAGTATPSGAFVSAYGGNLNPIQEISVRGDRLVFGFVIRDVPEPGQPQQLGHLIYTARLEQGRLLGEYRVEGEKAVVRWTGTRAPEIADRDDGSWKEGQPIALFNGKDLAGWEPIFKDVALGWSVKDGRLANNGHANTIISKQKFWNFVLRVECRILPGGNSGLGLRGRYEVQIKDDFGKQLDDHANGSLYSRIRPSELASRPAGEWQEYEVRLVGREVSVKLNGKQVILRGEIEGLTAMATNPDEAEPGGISLQGDHGLVEFRKMELTPLVK